MKIAVFSCDCYADVAPAWWHCFKANWADCPYDVEFVTNSKKLDVPVKVHYLKGQDLEFGKRLRRYLDQYGDPPLVLIFMSDYLIKSSDQTLVARAEALCHRHDVVHVRLRPMPAPSLPFDAPGFGTIDKGTQRYVLSLQPGIWKVDTLRQLSRDDENPWRMEIQGSGRARNAPGLFLSTEKHAVAHLNYYMKGRVTPKTLEWVKANVPESAWPDAVRKKTR